MNALSPEQYNALRDTMRSALPQDIGKPDMGKTLDILNRGTIAGTLGGPVDLASMLLAPLGYSAEKPVMGSEWIGDRMQYAGMVSGKRYPVEEMLASFVDPLSMPAAMGIFAGKGAKLADMLKLKEAEQLLEAGEDAASVWRRTGWGVGPDGKWRFEIPDDKVEFLNIDNWPGVQGDVYRSGQSAIDPLLDFMPHKEFSDNYPDVNPMAILSHEDGFNGKFHQDKDIIELGQVGGYPSESTALHELQHAIQEREGFAMGGSPTEFPAHWSGPAVNKLQGEIAELQGKLAQEKDPIKRKRLESIVGTKIKTIGEWLVEAKGERPLEQYKRLSGEAEARLTQHRMNLSSEDRVLLYPWEPEYFEKATGVPVDRLIYRYND